MELNESKADALDYNESSEHEILDDAEALICGEDEEALYPGIECFDIVECNNPDLLVSSVRDSEHFDLPSNVLKLVAENPQDATIIYLRIKEPRINRSKKRLKQLACIPVF